MSLSATSTLFLNTSRDIDSTASLGSLFQYLTPSLEAVHRRTASLVIFWTILITRIQALDLQCMNVFLWASSWNAVGTILNSSFECNCTEEHEITFVHHRNVLHILLIFPLHLFSVNQIKISCISLLHCKHWLTEELEVFNYCDSMMPLYPIDCR